MPVVTAVGTVVCTVTASAAGSARYAGDNRVARIVRKVGQWVVMRRVGEATTIQLKGKLIKGAAESIGGTAEQSETRLKIGPVEFGASVWAERYPKRKDTAEVGDRVRQVLDVRPLKDRGTVMLYELTLAG